MELRTALGAACVGALVAGVYGAVHDQITFGMAPEYFTRVKFRQFRFADAGLGDRVFASTIGFIAAASVGFVITWFLARRATSHGRELGHARRRVALGDAVILGCAILGGIAAYGYGHWRGGVEDRAGWSAILQEHRINDRSSFVRVACIHNGGYGGALVGFVAAFWWVRPSRHTGVPKLSGGVP